MCVNAHTLTHTVAIISTLELSHTPLSNTIKWDMVKIDSQMRNEYQHCYDTFKVLYWIFCLCSVLLTKNPYVYHWGLADVLKPSMLKVFFCISLFLDSFSICRCVEWCQTIGMCICMHPHAQELSLSSCLLCLVDNTAWHVAYKFFRTQICRSKTWTIEIIINLLRLSFWCLV